MILENKIILIMGIRNKWSIAYGAAKAAAEQGAKLCFTFISISYLIIYNDLK